jgi:hypothetical protein
VTKEKLQRCLVHLERDLTTQTRPGDWFHGVRCPRTMHQPGVGTIRMTGRAWVRSSGAEQRACPPNLAEGFRLAGSRLQVWRASPRRSLGEGGGLYGKLRISKASTPPAGQLPAHQNQRACQRHQHVVTSAARRAVRQCGQALFTGMRVGWIGSLASPASLLTPVGGFRKVN